MRLGNLSNSVKIYENIDKDHKYQIYEEYIENDTYITYRPQPNYIYSCTYKNNPLKDQIALTYIAPILLRKVKKVLILGAGAGENIRQLRVINKELDITAIDINPEVFEIACKFFDVEKSKNIHLIVFDAMEFLIQTKDIYDCIIVDVYKGDSIPYNCLTKEFFELIYTHLSSEGMLFMNTNFTGKFEKFEKRDNVLWDLQSTIYAAGFQSMYRNDINNMGIHYAFKQKIAKIELVSQLYALYNENERDTNLRAALGAMILCLYDVSSNRENTKIISLNSTYKEESKRKYYSKRILNINRFYLKNRKMIDNSNEIRYITVKYLFQQLNETKKNEQNDIWYDLLNIDNPNYYMEIFDTVKNNLEFDKIIEDVVLPNNFSISSIAIPENQNGKILWYYIRALELIRNDFGTEALEYIDIICDFLLLNRYIIK